ncbi:hypothetical protein AB0C52_05895 [Streptomyces sp. NPDC048717]|uniref:hypothetical protein n=1 Tax=Streptomyces sp. NPDC048717 TaxID=3154928 RepID=UPI003439B079
MVDARVVAMCVLLAETVIGGVVLLVWSQTEESPVPFLSGFNALTFGVLPIGGGIAAVFQLAVAAFVVVPLVALAGWAGRRLGARESWYWVPLTVAACCLPPVVGGLPALGTGLFTALVTWLVTTVALTIPALAARRMQLPDRPHLSVGVMIRRVALYGTLAFVVTAVLGGVVLDTTGIAYEPPRLTRESVVGTYTDDRGGTLVLTADGVVTAHGLRTHEGDYSEEEKDCTGTGRWSFSPGRGPWDQTMETSLDTCFGFGTWGVMGTAERPKLFVYIGDPDSWDLYAVERGAPAGA